VELVLIKIMSTELGVQYSRRRCDIGKSRLVRLTHYSFPLISKKVYC
jgi:hypothetical protein